MTATNDCFEVHKKDGTKCLFTPSKKGLFYWSVDNDVETLLVKTTENKISKHAV